MLVLSYIRDNKKQAIEALEKRNFKNAETSINDALDLDQSRKNLQQELDLVLSRLNSLSKEIGSYMKAGNKEEAEKLKKETESLKESAKSLESELKEKETELNDLLLTIPNLPHESVPSGKSAEDNIVVFEEGAIPNLKEYKKPHWEIIKDLDIVDFDLGNKITGAGFPVYKGKGARIQRALINFFLDEAIKEGYIEIEPPILVNEASGYATGNLPDKEGQMYEATLDGLYLIPTAEIPVTNMYRDQIIDASSLPLKNVAYTPCFRREAGSWGAHVRGLNRLHQFDKVEIVQIVEPSKSYDILDQMVNHVKNLLNKLELPYRILRLCGGDMGFTSALTYDFEVFSAAQERWLEVSSVSNFETFQANRLKLRTKVDGKSELLHTLNGSALALPRILASILENNQGPEGIKIPKVLHTYCGFDTI